jgi:pimeloyl-ACP methyl ester carboxylesterase
MATYVLIHGAGDAGWYWHLVETELRKRGHDTVAPDLPDDESAGWWECAEAVIDAIGDRTSLVVVGQSLGAFTAPLVCDRMGADLLVLVAGMIPAPGETPNAWSSSSGFESAARDREVSYEGDIELYYHDVAPDLAAEALSHAREEAGGPADEPWPLDAWPDVPTRFLLCRDDRVFPAEFLRRLARDRLGVTADEIDGGHTPALSRPLELADRLERYRAEAAVS